MSTTPPENPPNPGENPPNPPADTPPNPPAPTPEPPKQTHHDGPSRDEFNTLTSVVTTLAETVQKLVPTPKDTTPLDKGPWIYRGGAKKVTENE